MTSRVISYKLNSDGTIPDFVKDGGYLAKNGDDTPNMVLFGISKEGSNVSGAEFVFADEASALSYVNKYMSDSTIIDPNTNEEREFVVADAVASLFAKLA